MSFEICKSFDILDWFYLYSKNWRFYKFHIISWSLYNLRSSFFQIITFLESSVELTNFINARSIYSNGGDNSDFLCEGNKFTVILNLTKFSAGCCKQFIWDWNLLCSHFYYYVIHIPLAQSFHSPVDYIYSLGWLNNWLFHFLFSLHRS